MRRIWFWRRLTYRYDYDVNYLCAADNTGVSHKSQRLTLTSQLCVLVCCIENRFNLCWLNWNWHSNTRYTHGILITLYLVALLKLLLFNICTAYASCSIFCVHTSVTWKISQMRPSERNDTRLRTLFTKAVVLDQQPIGILLFMNGTKFFFFSGEIRCDSLAV